MNLKDAENVSNDHATLINEKYLIEGEYVIAKEVKPITEPNGETYCVYVTCERLNQSGSIQKYSNYELNNFIEKAQVQNKG